MRNVGRARCRWIAFLLIAAGCDANEFSFSSYYRVSSGMQTMCFSPDARWGAAPDANMIRIVGTDTGANRYALEGTHEASALAFTPDNRYLVSGNSPAHHLNVDWDLNVWDLTTRMLRTTRLIRQGFAELAVSGDGTLAGIGCNDGVVRMFSLPDLEPRGEFRTTSNWHVRNVAFVPGGHRVAVLETKGLDFDSNTLALFDADGGQQLARRSAPGAYVLATTRTMIAIAGSDDMRLVDAATLHDVRQLVTPVSASIATAAFSPDGEEVAFGTSADHFYGPGVIRYAVRDGKALPSAARSYHYDESVIKTIDDYAHPNFVGLAGMTYLDQGNRMIIALRNGNVLLFMRR